MNMIQNKTLYNVINGRGDLFAMYSKINIEDLPSETCPISLLYPSKITRNLYTKDNRQKPNDHEDHCRHCCFRGSRQRIPDQCHRSNISKSATSDILRIDGEYNSSLLIHGTPLLQIPLLTQVPVRTTPPGLRPALEQLPGPRQRARRQQPGLSDGALDA